MNHCVGILQPLLQLVVVLFLTPQRYIMHKNNLHCTFNWYFEKRTLRSEVKARVFPKIKRKYLASTRLNSHHDAELLEYTLRRFMRQTPHHYDPEEMCKTSPLDGEIFRTIKLCVIAPESALFKGPPVQKCVQKYKKLSKITIISHL